MQSKITSLSNPRVKNVVHLRDNQKRLTAGLSLVEGLREVDLALGSKIAMKEVYLCPELLAASESGTVLKKIMSLKIPVYETSKEVFSKISYGNRREGILAVFETPDCALSKIKIKKDSLYVLLEKVEKPGNLGAILRTCDSAGVDGVIVCQPKTDVFNPNVVRASLGTVFAVSIFVGSNEDVYDLLHEKDIRILSATPQAKKDYTALDLTRAVLLAFGSEQDGLSDFWMERSQEKVRIPMRGKADSLNVSASTAIFLYEALRQRSEVR